MASDRSAFIGKPGWRSRGTSQSVFKAFCNAFATPRVPRNVPMMPTIKPTPERLRDLMFVCNCWPITGNSTSADFKIRRCKSGSLRSTMPRIVMSSNSSGKTASIADHAMTAARLPALSSPNFLTTA